MTTVTADLPDWSTYAGEAWPTLVLGNGLSINLWQGFRYDALVQKSKLSAAAQQLFTDLSTSNFETVLECLHHARLTLGALSKRTGKVDRTYRRVRDALFKAVNKSHVEWDRFPQPTHEQITRSIATHRSVFTTN